MADYTDLLLFVVQFVCSATLRNSLEVFLTLLSEFISPHYQVKHFAAILLHTDNFLKLGGLFVTEAHTKVQIDTQKNGG